MIDVLFRDHFGMYPYILQTPQVLPAANLIHPFSPQLVPQEFLIFQFPSTKPTRRTAWLIEESQFEKTPELYEIQLEASTVTETGKLWTVFCNALHPPIGV